MTIGSSSTVTGTKSPMRWSSSVRATSCQVRAEDPLLLELEDVGVEVVARRAASRRGGAGSSARSCVMRGVYRCDRCRGSRSCRAFERRSCRRSPLRGRVIATVVAVLAISDVGSTSFSEADGRRTRDAIACAASSGSRCIVPDQACDGRPTARTASPATEELREQDRRLAILPIAMLVLRRARAQSLAARPRATACATPAIAHRRVTCSATHLRGRHDPRLDRPGVSAAVVAQLPRRRRSRASTSTSPTRSAQRLGVDGRVHGPAASTRSQGGNWSERWDMSVGSVTITETRAGGPRLHAAVLLHAGADGDDRWHRASTSLEDLLGHDGLRRRGERPTSTGSRARSTLTEDAGEVTDAARGHHRRRRCRPTSTAPRRGRPAGASSTGWLSSSTTVQGAIDEGYPVVAVGDPVFFEPLAVCFDKSASRTTTRSWRRSTRSSTDMHEDGTLTGF